MRLALVLLLSGAAAVAYRVHTFDGCELVGHDPYWANPELRVCRRPGCSAKWRSETTETIGATTTNQRYGW